MMKVVRSTRPLTMIGTKLELFLKWLRVSKLVNNLGHWSSMITMVKAAHASMQHYSPDSMVNAVVFLPIEAYQSAGCALILARSFARIHETNLKVSLNLFR